MTFRKLLFFFIIFSTVSCQAPPPQQRNNRSGISGNIIIFHAGSLAVPFQKIAKAFEQENPGTRVLLEAAGSVDCARKITDLHKPCDLMASSDYKVIQKFLIPEYTSWYMPFASNEIVLAYTDKSVSADLITRENWFELLLQDEVHFGRADPNADPCGYRTVMVMQLASDFYEKPDLVALLSSKDIKNIRPKEVDLLAILELHETDYIFIYKSVAIQHNLRYLELPPEINLKSINLNDKYEKAVVSIKGSTPDKSLEIKGEAITYAITMLDDAPNPEAAGAFLHFLLNEDKGIKILKETGHNSLIPLNRTDDMILPQYLKRYTIEKQ